MDNYSKQNLISIIAMASLLFSAILSLYFWSSSYSSHHLFLAPRKSLTHQESKNWPGIMGVARNNGWKVVYILLVYIYTLEYCIMILLLQATSIHNHLAYEDYELDSALSKASMERNRTMIIGIINKAYVEQDLNDDTTMLDMFLSSFWIGEGTRHLVDHLLIVAVDKTAYDRCVFLRLNCYMLRTEDLDFEDEKIYMSKDFIKMMWRRTRFLLEVLKRGYNFVFTDTDVMWFRDPFTKLSKNETEDLQISTDIYNGNPWSQIQSINTGFYFVRSNKKTISLFETWYGKKDNSTGQKEQDVLQDLIRNNGIIGKLGLRVRFLDTLYFSGFCQDSRDFGEVVVVHANCCRSISAKVKDLKAVLHDWKRFKRLKGGKSMVNLKWTKHVACLNSWGNPNKTMKG